MAIGPFSSSKQSATDNRNAATDDAVIRVVSGKGAKVAERGSVQVGDKGSLQVNDGVQLKDVTQSEITFNNEGVSGAELAEILNAQTESANANTRDLVDRITESVGTAPPSDAPENENTEDNPPLLDRATEFVKENKKWIGLGLLALAGLWIFRKAR